MDVGEQDMMILKSLRFCQLSTDSEIRYQISPVSLREYTFCTSLTLYSPTSTGTVTSHSKLAAQLPKP